MSTICIAVRSTINWRFEKSVINKLYLLKKKASAAVRAIVTNMKESAVHFQLHCLLFDLRNWKCECAN